VTKARPIHALMLLCLVALPASAGVDGRNPSAPNPTSPAEPTPMIEYDTHPAPDADGDAPDFQYLSSEGRWRFLHEMLRHDAVLLVFEPSDAQLLKLEAGADSLRHSGVIPVAIRRCPDGANWAAIGKLGLTYSLMSDPQGELEGDFHIGVAAKAGAETKAASPSWFLVDRKGRVAALERGSLPATGFAPIVAGAMQARDVSNAVK
jgi:peroxiredoxin